MIRKIMLSVLILAMFLPFIFVSDFTVLAQTNALQVSEDLLSEFLVQNPDRTPFSQGEKDTSVWIKDKFELHGLTSEVDDFETEINGKIYNSQNVTGLLDTASEKQIIIAAHYDNMYGTDVINGFGAQGAYNNGSGVAVMLALAEHISEAVADETINLNFDIRFLALGAEEVGFFGSKDYTNEMTFDERNNTLLMIDLDCVGGGDYLYLYCDEVKTMHQDFIKDVADENGLTIKLPPANKKTFSYPTPITPYTHYGLGSGNVYFMEKGINSAHFLSLNWETTQKMGMVESENHPPIIHTSDDTLKTLQEYYGDTYLEKMNTAANIIFNSITKENFVTVMEQSKSSKANYSWWTSNNLAMYIKAGIIFVFAGIILLLIKHYNTRYPMPTIVFKQRPPDVFGDDYENKTKKDNDSAQKKDDINPFDDY